MAKARCYLHPRRKRNSTNKFEFVTWIGHVHTSPYGRTAPGWHSSTINVRFIRGAECNSHGYLVAANVKEDMLMSQQQHVVQTEQKHSYEIL
jgi:hypothetical protein